MIPQGLPWIMFEDWAFHRRLSDSDGNKEDVISSKDSKVLLEGLLVYGSFFLVMFLLFCWLRMKCPRTYNVRSWVPRLRCDLAMQHCGHFNWIWKLWSVSEDDIRDQCGMDALCYLRLLKFGAKVALLGMFNSVWLMPLYATAPVSTETSHISDLLVKITISNVPPGSPRLLATVLAIYSIFGCVFCLIVQELEWFRQQRHKFLMRRLPQNYAIYVSHIPPGMRSSSELLKYFRRSFPFADSVLEAHITLRIPVLEGLIAQRDDLVSKLEHAINIEDITGVTPFHREIRNGGARVNSIETWTAALQQVNREVRESLRQIEKMRELDRLEQDYESASSNVTFGTKEMNQQNTAVKDDAAISMRPGASTQPSANMGDELTEPLLLSTNTTSPREDPLDPRDSALDPTDHGDRIRNRERFEIGVTGGTDGGVNAVCAAGAIAAELTSTLTTTAGDLAAELTSTLTTTAGDLAANAASLFISSADGEPRESGFVVFSTLSSAQTALQMIHHPEPFTLTIAPAPDPEDILWDNIGKSHYALEVGKLISLALTVALCIFWTVPVAFAASLADVESLKHSLPVLKIWVAEFPWLEGFLAQLAPLVIVGLNAALPYILEAFGRLEFPISTSILEGSTFMKVTAFMIIQTFFVSAASGSITAQITAMVKNPTEVVNLLATTLPSQSTYFIQILLVQTFIGLSLELLRVGPLLYASFRKLIGPNLTEKERNTTFMTLRPLADPYKFEMAFKSSHTMLHFMVQFVYSAIAPLTNFFIFICFLLMISAYRHQFIYNYPSLPDSGGQIWTSFIQVSIHCMFIAQLTLIGLLLLKKSVLATPFMGPLMFFTLLFKAYIHQKHFHVTQFLPPVECFPADVDNTGDDGSGHSASTPPSGGHCSIRTMDFAKGIYVQPQLRNHEESALPDNIFGRNSRQGR